MPMFMKDEMKKKDEEKLAEMQKEIEEAARAKAEGKSYDLGDVAEKAAEEAAAAADEADAGEVPEEQAADDLQKQIEKLEAQLKEREDRVLRLQADFDNFRRRTRQEKEEIGAVVTQNILTDMLPLLDNFERAMQSEGKDAQGFRDGVEMIFKQFQDVLAKNGLEEIKTEGQKFDPNFHQAVMRVQNDGMEDESIAAELQKGYMAKGKVIRPSMVQVVAN